jgi:hypothetical protein
MAVSKGIARRMLLAGLLAGACAAPAMAQQADNGLGQAWPQATDVSASPNWHVYVFPKDGIKYIQVNDAAGNVHLAVAAANGHLVVLPMGADAGRVLTRQVAAGTPAPAPADGTETVYTDDDTQVTTAPQQDGGTQWTVTADEDCTSGKDCGIGH